MTYAHLHKIPTFTGSIHTLSLDFQGLFQKNTNRTLIEPKTNLSRAKKMRKFRKLCIDVYTKLPEIALPKTVSSLKTVSIRQVYRLK